MDAISDKADLTVTNSSVVKDEVMSFKTENKQLFVKAGRIGGIQKAVEPLDCRYP